MVPFLLRVAFAEMLKKIHCYQKHVDTMASLAVARPSVVEEVCYTAFKVYKFNNYYKHRFSGVK